MAAMVEVMNLKKHFGPIQAVDDISFSLERGEVLGFLGPNGAGKSTTMKMITGFLTPDSGTVRVAGHDLASDPIAVKSSLGYLPEGAPLYSDMTTRAFLLFIAAIRGYRGAAKDRRVDEIIEQVHLQSVVYQPLETLSKGYKRRVGLAQAILHDPQILILDEPTDGLDPNQKHEVRNLIRSMAQNKVIILSTHILEEVEALCSRAIIIAAGRVVADGTPAELEARSRLHNAVTLALLGVDAEQARAQLAKIDGVRAVERLPDHADGSIALRLLPESGRHILTPVSHFAHDAGWEVSELHVDRGRLDDVFRDITAQTQAA